MTFKEHNKQDTHTIPYNMILASMLCKLLSFIFILRVFFCQLRQIKGIKYFRLFIIKNNQKNNVVKYQLENLFYLKETK